MKNILSRIRPLVEMQRESVFKKYGFEITRVTLQLLEQSKWLRLIVDWNSKIDSFRFKYAKDGGRAWMGNEIYFSLDFPEVKYRFRTENHSHVSYAGLDIGLQIEGKNLIQFPYDMRYWENTKYGIYAYFSHKNWESKQKIKPLFDYHIEDEID